MKSIVETILVAGLALLAGAGLAAAQDDHVLQPGQKADGLIEQAAEEDLILVEVKAGTKLTFKVKAPKGGALLPIITQWTDPGATDRLGQAVVKTSKKGNLTQIKNFVADQDGTWTLGISGDAASSGAYELQSKGNPAKPVLGSGTIAVPGGDVDIVFNAHAGSDLLIQVKADKGSALHPFMASLAGPDGAVDLNAATRKTSTKKDQVKGLMIPATGEYTLSITGADDTTGSFTATWKVGKKVALDFTVDPPDEGGGGGGGDPDPPSVNSVNPTSFEAPAAGSASEGLTVSGTDFVNGAMVAITAPSGTNGISNVQTTFNSSSSLSVTFDLASTATAGSRTVTVTNPDAQDDALAAAFSVTVPNTSLTVDSVSPGTGSGTGGTAVIIQGNGFGADSTVTFGGEPAYGVNVVDDGNILCMVPAATALAGTSGTAVDVVVSTGGDDATLADGFTYDALPQGPTFSSSVPADNATGVTRSLNRFVFVLSHPADPSSVSGTGGFAWFQSGGSSKSLVNVTFGPDGRHVVLRHGSGTLNGSALHLVNIPNSVQDLAGNAFDPTPFVGNLYQAGFTTGSGTDGTAPSITSSDPASGATGVAVDTTIELVFDGPVDPGTVEAGILLKQGTTTLPAHRHVSDDCVTVTLTPRMKLDASTTYTVQLNSSLRDLSSNAASSTNRTFTTGAADGTAPTQELTLSDLPQDMNGSGTYVNSGGSGGNAFNAYIPRDGFTIDLVFADLGGSGVDPSSFAFTCSQAMGSVGAGQDLGSRFTVTPLGATWTVPSTHSLPNLNGGTVTFTANVDDYAGNAATQVTLTADSADITRRINNNSGNASNDRDPFNTRQTWLLRFDQDLYTISSSSGGSGNHNKPITVTSSLTGNGTADFIEDLTIIGLNGTESGTNASTVTNGTDMGTNDIVQTLVKEAIRKYVRMRYGIDADGTHGNDAVNIEFILPGEQGSLGSVPNPATWTGSSGYSIMGMGGDESANSNSNAIGRSGFDLRNKQEDDSSNTGATGGANVGVFGTHMIRSRINDFVGTQFPNTFDPLISTASRGGTPVGSSNLDAVVLDDSFVYASATQSQKDRYDLILAAVDEWSLYLSTIAAHEVGHSVGLVADGPPPTGLFGDAHDDNSFIVDGGYTSQAHIDTPGINVMESAASYTDAVTTGSGFGTFGPTCLAYLLRRMIYDQ